MKKMSGKNKDQLSMDRRKFLKASAAAATATTVGLAVSDSAKAQVSAAEAGWQWEARFAPMEVGTHTYEMIFARGSEQDVSGTRSLAVEPSERDGFLRVNPDSIATFRLDSGRLFRGVGENFGWTGPE